MILHFTDGETIVNINFDAETYNYNDYAGESFVIKVSADDLGRIQREMDFNCYGYTKDIYQAPNKQEGVPF